MCVLLVDEECKKCSKNSQVYGTRSINNLGVSPWAMWQFLEEHASPRNICRTPVLIFSQNLVVNTDTDRSPDPNTKAIKI